MSRRLVALLVAGLALTSIAGCSTDEGSGLAAVAAASVAPASGAELDAAGFASAAKRPGTVIIDVRTPAEFAEGHLAGAVNMDVQAADFTAKLAELDPTSTYAVYCRSGNRSAAALSQMAAVGFTNIYHLGGGIGAWQAAGGEVVTG